MDFADVNFHLAVNKMTVVLLSLSLISLLVSLVIFWSFQSLRCTRINIHTQMFISIALNNVSWILWYVIPLLINAFIISRNIC